MFLYKYVFYRVLSVPVYKDVYLDVFMYIHKCSYYNFLLKHSFILYSECSGVYTLWSNSSKTL